MDGRAAPRYTGKNGAQGAPQGPPVRRGKGAFAMSLGNSLHEARRKSGLSQEAVAEKLGVSRQTVSKWERGLGYPDVSLINDLSSILGVDAKGGCSAAS